MEQSMALVRRVAMDLAPEDLQSEGETAVRLAALQQQYDEEYEAAVREHEAALRKLEMQKTKETYQDAVSTLRALEKQALACEPKTATIVHEVEANLAPQRLVARGLSLLGCCALLRAMRNNANVTSLDLSNNSLTDVVGVSVGQMLAANRTLRALDLGFNHLTNRSLLPLGDALRANSVLTSLVLESNPVFQLQKDGNGSSGGSGGAVSGRTASTDSTTKGSANMAAAFAQVEPFMAALVVNSGLASLNLFNTGINYEVGRALAQSLAKNASLLSVEIAGNTLSQSDMANMATMLKKNQARQLEAEAKSNRLHHEMKQESMLVRAEKAKQAKQRADAEWHDENARKRAEIREAEEWERARRVAEEDVQHLLDMEAENKKYLERLEAEKKPAKGKKK